MGRLIQVESAGKERTQLMRSIVLALRELMRQQDTDRQTRDLAAYIVLALDAIAGTVENSVAAWEKRGYWVKADRFRMDWDWTSRLGSEMRKALVEENWQKVALTAAQVAEKVKSVEVPQRHRLGIPWQDAWEKLCQSKQG